jgi:hypothetical protein
MKSASATSVAAAPSRLWARDTRPKLPSVVAARLPSLDV